MSCWIASSRRVAGIPGVRVYFLPVQDIQISTRSSRSLYQYTLTAADADEVADWSNRLIKEMRSDPIFRDVSSEGQEGGLRAFLNVDRERAGQLGVSLQSVNDTLNDAFGQRQISTIYGQANQYRVVLEALPGIPARSERPVEALRAGSWRRARCRSRRSRRWSGRPRRLRSRTRPSSRRARISFNLAPESRLARRSTP